MYDPVGGLYVGLLDPGLAQAGGDGDHGRGVGHGAVVRLHGVDGRRLGDGDELAAQSRHQGRTLGDVGRKKSLKKAK